MFNGEVQLAHIQLDPPLSLVDCSQRAEELRLNLSEYNDQDARGQGWFLKDGSGTWQGHICQ
jgi:hypothetical protein